MSRQLFIYGLDEKLVSGSLLSRQDVSVRSFPNAKALIDELVSIRPTAVVASLTKADVEAVLDAWSEGRFSLLPLVLIAKKPHATRLIAQAQRIEEATLILGETRFKPRLSEAVAKVVGTKPRFHSRRTVAKPWTAGLISEDADGRDDGASVLDWSFSGARVASDLKLAEGGRCALSFKVPSQTIRVQCIVRRVALPVEEKYCYGLEFVKLSTEDKEAIFRHLTGSDSSNALESEPPRSHPRARIPRSVSLTVRLRLGDKRQVGYLKVVDLSEGGFLAQAKSYQPLILEVGRKLEVELMAGTLKVSSRVEVLRKQQGATDKESMVAFRFLEVTAAAAQGLRRLLEQIEERGLQGATAMPASYLPKSRQRLSV